MLACVANRMSTPGPNLIIVAGPNGAGKTTAAADILVGALAVHEFVNADTIAKGLSAFQPESVAFDAGRMMLAAPLLHGSRR